MTEACPESGRRPADELAPLSTVAKALGVSPRTLLRLVTRGELHGEQIPNPLGPRASPATIWAVRPAEAAEALPKAAERAAEGSAEHAEAEPEKVDVEWLGGGRRETSEPSARVGEDVGSPGGNLGNPGAVVALSSLVRLLEEMERLRAEVAALRQSTQPPATPSLADALVALESQRAAREEAAERREAARQEAAERRQAGRVALLVACLFAAVLVATAAVVLLR
jgi:ribosomal protein L12E/L44/L45/RPP1/RPP2